MAYISSFHVPKTVTINEETATDRYSEFIIEPFQTGFGHTIGNSMRRVLLSSLEGSAISAVRIEGVAHEFASMPHVIEDVTEIVLNLKGVKLFCQSDAPKVLQIKKESAGPVTAGDIITDHTIEILNPEHVICTLDKKTIFAAEIEISKGRGYTSSEENKKDDHPLGTIAIDSLFSPVERVRYEVGAARYQDKTEMDSLRLEIWTDGRMSPQDALEKSAKILQDHLRPFLGGQAGEDNIIASIPEEEQKLYKKLIQNVDILELSVRASNCLTQSDIRLLGELCIIPESKLSKVRNFGKKSLDEIKEKLEEEGLSLGMKFGDELKAALELEGNKLRNPEEEEI